MSATFKIIFNGQLHQDADITSVQEQLAQFLKIPHDIVIQLFDGKSYALKKDLTSIDAVKTESSLKKLGLITKVEPERTAPVIQSQNSQLVCPKHIQNNDKKVPVKTNDENSAVQSKKAQLNTVFEQTNVKTRLLSNTLKSALYLCYLALFIVTLFGLSTSYTVIKSTFTSDESVQSKLSYQQYKLFLNEQNSTKHQPQIAIAEQGTKTDSTENNEYFSKFSAHINRYAKTLGQVNINAMGGDKLQQHLQEIDDLGPKNEFWKQLILLAKNLDNDSHKMSALQSDDSAKIHWINAVDWISQSYIRQHQSTDKPNTKSEPPAKGNPILSLTLLISLLSLLSIFVIAIKMKLRAIKNS
ncbi:MAG: hypothetical protein ACI6PR_11425 [Pseudoalteromonas sp.]|uniref:hypothetical protein n=1 Tax=Pseudoalteromonas sp. TaxID=53249 RepID=UPI0038501523